MFHVIPDALFLDRRGICPTCGSTYPLPGPEEEARCGRCGAESRLELRAREIEAGSGLPGDATDWVDSRTSVLACPRCDASLGIEQKADAAYCRACGAHSRLEARLVTVATGEAPRPVERTRADFENQARRRIDYPFEIETEQLVYRILTEPDLPARVALARKFENWGYINRTAVHFLPALLAHIQADHDAVALEAGDVVGKLLCNEDETLWPPVLEACSGVLFDTAGKRCLLDEVALGKSVCVKLLIDVAEFAETRGDAEYAACALLGINTLVGRNFDDIPLIAAIVLYRLYDVTGVVLGWALDALKTSYLRARLPPGLMIPVIDDLGEERPRIVPHVLECLVADAPATEEDYRERLGFIREAKGWAGRAAGLEILGVPPIDDSALWAAAVAAVDEFLDDPGAGEAAEKALYALVCAKQDGTADAVDELVVRRGESLSYRVKREYIRRRPDTDLLDTSAKYYWQADVKRALDDETEARIGRYKAGLHAALRRREEDRQAIRPLLDEARHLDVPVFLRESPATIPVPDDRNPELIEAKRDAERKRVNEAIEALNNGYSARIKELSAEMMRSMNDMAAVQRISAEMTRLGEVLQHEMEKLWGE